MAQPTYITLSAELTEEQAMALAQFVKRAGYQDCRDNAVSREEAYTMLSALTAIQRDLAEKGFAPR